ncbi:YiiD C-terminal domain-containing protein [Shewanella japonica]|uniref:YiiD C-terminal domain-containing protein n=1 Tax=Shewanella japonica TaxID=93973 RepID=UPI00249557C6|nr:YiiD C-terminal domain-containing protein [Shewanella japonica]
MKNRELEAYLHHHIPVSKSLGIGVNTCSVKNIELTAPLKININHMNTVFGGSLSVVGILAGWSLVYAQLEVEKHQIVIQENNIRYLKPANGDVRAICKYDNHTMWSRFHRAFQRKGKGRVHIACNLFCADELVATFEGIYVVFNKK